MTAIKVSFEWYEMLEAAYVGVLRRIEALRLGKRDAHGAAYTVERDWTIDIEGALAERAVAKALGLYWSGGVNTWKAPDLSTCIQVRLSRARVPRLIVRPIDPDDQAYVLVGYGPQPHEYVVYGWLWGKDAKQEKYIDDPKGRPYAYFVPISDLCDLRHLTGGTGRVIIGAGRR